MREHGTHACYVFGPEPGGDTGKGCRCDDCRRAARDYERERSQRRVPAYVGADRSRKHVEWLRGQGVGLKTIAKAAGVAHGTLAKLTYGDKARGMGPSKRVRKATEDKILSVTARNAADGARVDAAATWANVAKLRAAGWTKTAIGHALGQNSASLQLGPNSVTVANARAVADLLDLPVPERRSRWGPRKADTDEGAEDRNDQLAEVIAARSEIDALPVIDPTVFDAEWRKRAACRLLAPDERWIFWPGRGDHRTVAAAKKICASCPVSGACLAYAVQAGEMGVWGGTSDRERRGMKAAA